MQSLRLVWNVRKDFKGLFGSLGNFITKWRKETIRKYLICKLEKYHHSDQLKSTPTCDVQGRPDGGSELESVQNCFWVNWYSAGEISGELYIPR